MENLIVPSFIVKSGIIRSMNINSLPSSISKSADSKNEVAASPFTVKISSGSLLYKLLPATLTPVVIVLSKVPLSTKVVKIPLPYVQ